MSFHAPLLSYVPVLTSKSNLESDFFTNLVETDPKIRYVCDGLIIISYRESYFNTASQSDLCTTLPPAWPQLQWEAFVEAPLTIKQFCSNFKKVAESHEGLELLAHGDTSDD
jgi:hypothetical protein